MLMAISPVPPLVPAKQKKVGGRVAYSRGLYVALVGLAVVIVPLSVQILDRLYPAELQIPPGGVIRNTAFTVLIPLLAGLALHRFAPAFAERAVPIIEKASMALLVLAFLPIVIASGPAMAALVGNGSILTVVLIVAVALLAGHLLAGDDPRDKAALAMTAATRHPGIALMIGGASFKDPRVTAAIVGFLVVGMLATLPYNIWMKRRLAAAPA
jgi:BASS family bile acid:Na+ symporter